MNRSGWTQTVTERLWHALELFRAAVGLAVLDEHYPPQGWVRKIGGTLLAGAVAIIIVLWEPWPIGPALRATDNLLYDGLYAIRPAEMRPSARVAVVRIGDEDLERMATPPKPREPWPGIGWPWPREYWGVVVAYLDACGARAVAFDLQFSTPSVFNLLQPDDEAFGQAVASVKIPILAAAKYRREGPQRTRSTPLQLESLAPGLEPLQRGAVEIDQTVLREYDTFRGPDQTVPSLAAATLRELGETVPDEFNAPFLLHFYGPPVRPDRGTTLPYFPAAQLYAHAVQFRDINRAFAQGTVSAAAKPLDEDVARYRGRIVLVGGVAAALYDNFKSPVADPHPGVDSHATAIENILSGDRVRLIDRPTVILAVVLTALWTAGGAIFASRLAGKLVFPVLGFVGLGTASYALFMGRSIEFLPAAAPATAGVLGFVGGLVRNFATEDARRRFMIRALGQYVSPTVSERLAARPDLLRLGAEQREMTCLFSDLAGFTDFSELAPVETLSAILNRYMDTMSGIIRDEAGTIDKYIGDAIMAFWNAPLEQPDHALRACRAAIRIKAAEARVREQVLTLPEVQEAIAANPKVALKVRGMGDTELYTRMGVHTGPMNVGNWGSREKFQYTVIGDAVNAAARLEPTNKRYGTRVLISGDTVERLRSLGALSGPRPELVVRLVDLVKVKGKTKAMELYELVGLGSDTPDGIRRAAELYAQAFDHYRQRRWDDAQKLLEEVDQLTTANTAATDSGLAHPPADSHGHAGDGPSRVLLDRIRAFRVTPPPADWDGSYTATEK